MGAFTLRRSLLPIAAWLPFYALWTSVAMSSGVLTLRDALTGFLVAMGSLRVQHGSDGFEATFVVPTPSDDVETALGALS